MTLTPQAHAHAHELGRPPAPGPDPYGAPVAAGDVELHRLAAEQRSHEHLQNMCVELHKQLLARDTPAELRNPLVLTAAAPIQTDMAGGPCKSVGILNPNSVTVYLGIGGARPAPGQRSISAAPKSLLILPLTVENLDVGADPVALAAGDAVVYVLRFATVQAAYMAAMA